jgi:nuclear-control-of-ATPase protein 2
MDGIEKMLKSQQLTFGFVGVAPSMLILVAFGRWVRNMTRSDGGAKRKAEERKKCWMVIR